MGRKIAEWRSGWQWPQTLPPAPASPCPTSEGCEWQAGVSRGTVAQCLLKPRCSFLVKPRFCFSEVPCSSVADTPWKWPEITLTGLTHRGAVRAGGGAGSPGARRTAQPPGRERLALGGRKAANSRVCSVGDFLGNACQVPGISLGVFGKGGDLLGGPRDRSPLVSVSAEMLGGPVFSLGQDLGRPHWGSRGGSGTCCDGSSGADP